MTSTRKTPWLWMLLLALVAAAASSGAMYVFMSQARPPVDKVAKADTAENKPQAPRLVTIAPMTVNLQNERNEQSLLYVGFALEVGNDATQTLLLQYMPQIRSQLLTLLSGQDSTPLANPQGKELLAGKILEMVKQSLAGKQPELSVLNVLYTDFIVQ
ncbi:flagellar basal body-associated FliL family protein [Pseudomonas ogarae]|uniref:Flagellar protein FliL n=1 Tax=Pseudomonas ogarae (strain DSM 112162 / CECT 30235 / F113) TaxID=1114970 RepID=A0ABN5G1E8_PSEO1|nr:flagellar basal body-associated FliL family protein [Pseudomonas ogarae]AEV60793.1 FliL2 [Pseudomonas ogarae]AUO44670.1 flagellar basal body-associated protein FliL [Pseudomonas ogarae]